MRILYLSPGFPPKSHLFCLAAQRQGANVVAVGDMPASGLPPDAQQAFEQYVFEPRMGEYEVLLEVVRALVAARGRIDFIESNGEHWLEFEGRLRDDLDVEGLSAEDVQRLRSKLAMGAAFDSAGVPSIPGVRCSSKSAIMDFVGKHGLPVVFKPDSGSGATSTFRVSNMTELEAACQLPLSGHIVQPFIEGVIQTFDGLVDARGRVVFFTSHVYDQGIMELRTGVRDGFYYSLRGVLPAFEDVGRRALAAFSLRRRFFHLEFFVRPDGTYVALEMNVRPPGGFTTDMINWACDFDVYALWAAVMLGDSLEGFTYERKFHSAHAGRRRDRIYMRSHEVVVDELGDRLVDVVPIPGAFAVTMGDVAYLLRDRRLEGVLDAIRRVQQPGNEARTQDESVVSEDR